MPFPNSERVIYRQNPLKEVICQIQFPTILQIEASPPAVFQERVRDRYPLYEESSGLAVASTIVRGGQINQIGPRVRYVFQSNDRLWSIALTREFIALSTSSYRRWEEFRERIEFVRRQFGEVYHPSFFSRVGLRYVNLIQRSSIGIEGRSWSELLNPRIAGELGDQTISDYIEHVAREVRVRLEEQGHSAMIRHGIVFAEPTNEECYIIDSDFYAETETETGIAIDYLNRFNRHAGNLFRWCIERTLYEALEPHQP
ncbi:MAG: TIGR04255 family protein [Planctomycetes bacterium]|nr:TIGR04255 family protein [Planctomycetota bacterium]MBI3834314.1 TIGR04255 family protein [Planctomycetota bacterium]